ncbi:MAG: hypothetical protein P8100_11695 [bacterium]|jgi:spermidine synthase
MGQKGTGINRRIYADVFLLGFLLLGAQIILVREFLIIYNGNELVIGILFSIWMLCTALGAWMGRYLKPGRNYSDLIRLLLVFIALYPAFAAFGIAYYRNSIFEVGRLISLYGVLYFSLIVLLPLCFLGGFTYTLINITTSRNPGSLQNCYSYESAGSLTGGLITSLLFIYYLQTDNLTSLQYLALIAFIHFGVTEFRLKRYFLSLLYLLAAFGIMHVVYNYDLTMLSKAKLFPDQQVLQSLDSPYGNITVTRQQNQTNLFLDGQLLSSDNEPVRREEDVHYAMLQRKNASRVLMFGGALTGAMAEVNKYREVEQIVYVDQNSFLPHLAGELNLLDMSDKIDFRFSDPVLFLKKNTGKFDVVLISEPPPTSAQFNRFYTVDFFTLVKQHLNLGGILSTSLPSSQNYLSDNELLLHSSLYNSLCKVFRHVLLVPGDRYYFLASDDSLTLAYSTLQEESHISNTYVNEAYLDDRLMKIRSENTLESYLEDAPLNYNFRPVVYYLYIRHWLSYFGISFWIIPFFCLLIVGMFYFFTHNYATAMFTSGITGVSTELVLIVVFQVLFGNVYLFIGIIITTFMAGLAIGSRFSLICKMNYPLRLMNFVQLFSGIYILSIALTIFFIGKMEETIIIRVIFIFAMFILAAFTGLQYGISVCHRKTDPGTLVSEVYAADLVGAAVGSLAVTVWLIPMIGIYQSVLVMASLHFLTLILLRIKSK